MGQLFVVSEEPPAMAAIEEDGVPFVKHFKLNNSAFFVTEDMTEDDKEFNELFW